jgi:transposase-like protein
MEKKERKSIAKKPDANNAEIKYAETLYVEKGLSPQAIAEELGRNIKTIYAWRDKYRWDATKDLFQSGPTELKKILLNEAVRIAKGEKRLDAEGNEVKGIDADSLSKVMKAYDYMNQKLSIEVFRDAFVEFDYWMVTVDAKIAGEFTKYHKMFLQNKISQEN